jgi:Methyltransferase domain
MIPNLESPKAMRREAETPSSLKAARLLLPVWGDHFVKQFLEYSLPTLLAKGNLPSIAKELPCEFEILTSRENEAKLRAHKAFARLTELCPVTIRPIDHLITNRNYSTTITMAYAEAIRACGPAMLDTCFIFLVSDYVMADGSLSSVLAKIKAGANAVQVGNFQVSSEKALPWLRSQLATQTAALSLSSRQLMGWAMKHLHPATLSNIVNNPAAHNAHTNRLFWRVDRNTLLGRFYLMHMIAIRPEKVDFEVGASCDYSFVPEMCPSGNVVAINDSDDYLVIEMQPEGHESRFQRAGLMPIKELALTLSDWTTSRHRENAKETIIFHALELPPTLAKFIADADQYVARVNQALSRRPKPHRGHPYWLGAIAAHKEAIGQRLSEEEEFWLQELISRRSRWLGRVKNFVFGKVPYIRPWHPSWPDCRPILENLKEFLADEEQSLLAVSSSPTNWTVMLARCGERFRRMETQLLLKDTSTQYRQLNRKFDLCLLQLSENELPQLQKLLAQLAPLMKTDSKVLLAISSDYPMGHQISSRISSQVIAGSAWINKVDWVPVSKLRWKSIRIIHQLSSLLKQSPWLGIPLTAIYLLPMMFISMTLNLIAAGDTKRHLLGKACSSVLAVLQLDQADERAADTTGCSSIAAKENADLLQQPAAALALSVSGETTREPQYNNCLELKSQVGLETLGLMTNQVWNDDPRRLTFVLARYKFVAKMLAGRQNAGELGCGDAFGTRIVLQDVGNLTVYDFDPVFIEDVQSRRSEKWAFEAIVHDILRGPLPQKHDALYSLDVLEHIRASDEDIYLRHLCHSLTANGVLIIGTPSLESQTYASTPSKIGHINCKSGPELKAILQKYFESVFVFSMNDEVVHTGFYPMAHYLFAVCSQRKFQS